MKPRIIVLALAGVALLGWLLFGRGGGEAEAPAAAQPASALAEGDGAARPAGAAARGRSKKAFTADDIPVIASTRARVLDGEIFARERSLFAYAEAPEVVEARRRAAEEAARVAAEAAAAAAERERIQREEQQRLAAERAAADAARAQEAARRARENPPPPTPPEFRWDYIGVIGPMDDPYAILRGRDQKLTYARAGDVLDDDFRIEGVWEYRIDLSYVDPRFEGLVAQQPKQALAEGGARVR